MKEKLTGQITMKDLDRDTCYKLLDFIYTGQAIYSNISLELLVVADKYNMLDLKAGQHIFCITIS